MSFDTMMPIIHVPPMAPIIHSPLMDRMFFPMEPSFADPFFGGDIFDDHFFMMPSLDLFSFDDRHTQLYDVTEDFAFLSAILSLFSGAMVVSQGNYPHYYEMPQQQDSSFDPQEEMLRRQYGVQEGQELWTGIVQNANNRRHEQARQTNLDGGPYFTSIIDQHLSTLSPAEKERFSQLILDSDPEVCVELPKLAVKHAIQSSTPLTRENTPAFMHGHLSQLEALRLQRQNGANVQNGIGAVATALARETACIVSMQQAMGAFAEAQQPTTPVPPPVAPAPVPNR